MNNGTTLNSFETSHLEIQNEAQNSSLVNPGNINRGNNENEADQVIRFNSVQKQIVLNERKKGIRSHVHFPDEEDSKCNLLRPKSDYIQ
ncbi:hypothetical protein DPMN_062945 [Dreissena polymorpha]|nr:hypothetical protein DPMN_062945 [Dreissena polymorpha]